MTLEKIQGSIVDVNDAPEISGVNSLDYLLIYDSSTGETNKVQVGDITAGISGAIRLRGQSLMDDGSTTLTSIVVSGDTLNSSISQGMAPTVGAGDDPNGVGYLVVTSSPTGVQTEITGVSTTVYDGDQIVWMSTSWTVLELGSRVESVNGQTGNVVLTSSDVGSYSTSEADTLLSAKADLTYVNTELSDKADTSYVDSELSSKADISYVDTQDTLKVSKTGDTLSGGLTFNALGSTTYTNSRLPSYSAGTKTYLNRFRGGIGDTIWHETVQGGDYRVATGISDDVEVFRLHTGDGGNSSGYIAGDRIYTEGFKPTWDDVGGNTYVTEVSSSAHRVGESRWLTAATVGTGFLPYQQGTDSASNSYLGKYDSWFKESWVNIYRGNTMHINGICRADSHVSLGLRYPAAWDDMGGNTWMVKVGTYDPGWGDKVEIRPAGVGSVNRSAGFDVYNQRNISNTDLYEGSQRVYSANNPPIINWTEIINKPSDFTPAPHTHEVSDITNFPDIYVADWSKITNIPTYAQRWPTWTEVTNKPTGIINLSAYDARYLTLSGKAADSNLLDGRDSTYFYSPNNKPTPGDINAYTKTEVDSAIATAVASSGGPVGSVILWAFPSNIPSGYLELNGATISRTSYPDLVDLIDPGASTAVLPDWTDRYVRNDGGTPTVGDYLSDQNKSHTHRVTVNSTDLGTKTSSTYDYGRKYTNTTGYHTHNLKAAGGESRSGNQYNDKFPNSRSRGLSGYIDGDGNHQHYIDVGSHSHTVTIGSHNHTTSVTSSGSSEARPKTVVGKYLIKAL